MRPCILHVSADYPDAFQSAKTPVVRQLVEALSDCSRNIVLSINRVSRPDQEAVVCINDTFAIRYFSPPFGIFQSFFLNRLGDQIIKLLTLAGIAPDVVIGHKFTIESCLAWKISRHFKIRYVAAFMGNSDRKIFRLKPHYHRHYRRIAHGASAVVFPTFWCRDFFERRLHLKSRNTAGGVNIRVIPYISTELIRPVRSTPKNRRHFIVVCRLDVWRIKNLHRLIKAIASLRHESHDWKLDIVGAGSNKTISAIGQLIAKHGVADGVRLLGGMERNQIDTLLPNYSALVMPSYPESFGLVYLESLAQGVPIMTARHSGFDGFFANDFPGVVVQHDNVDAIKLGLQKLAQDGDIFRDIIARSSDEFHCFDRRSIVDNYRAALGV